MEMTGEARIPAPRQKVWDALNDPEVLKASLPGCESMERTEDGGYDAKIKAKVGPVSAKFSGEVELSDVDPPNGYTLSGQGKGGAAGFAKGSAKVRLADDPVGTLLTYEVNAQVGGKLAQIGSRLIDGTAKRMAADFFERFSAEVAGPPAPAEAAAAAAPPPTPAAEPEPAGMDWRIRPFYWVILVVLLVFLVLLVVN